jgi:D-glycero-D-manno-heptose 1,7-bisphosphate phosphatase
MNKAVFYDRDGIIIKMVYDLENGLIETAGKPSQIDFEFGIIQLLKHTTSLGYKNIIISNQAGIGIKKISEKSFNLVKDEMSKRLAKQKAKIDAQYYCFHHPHASIEKYKKTCNCRKPKPGLILQAAKDHSIDLSKSWMIGDSVNDVLAGNSAGVKTILLANLHESEYLRVLEEKLHGIRPEYLIKKLTEAVQIITK